MIHITSNAASQIRTMLLEREAPLPDGGLRIAVEDGGCSGRQYTMCFDSRKPDDRIFHENDADVLVDPASLALIDESTIDYADGLASAGFKILNPKAKQTCGCGTSFDA